MAEIIPFGGSRAACERCGVELRVASVRRDDENPSWVPRLRLAATPKGVCASCNVRAWFHLMEPVLETAMLGTKLPDALSLPHVQAQLLTIFTAAHSDPECGRDIDWRSVADNWHLPIPGVKAKRSSRGARR